MRQQEILHVILPVARLKRRVSFVIRVAIQGRIGKIWNWFFYVPNLSRIVSLHTTAFCIIIKQGLENKVSILPNVHNK